MVQEFEFTPTQREFSSGLRELLSIKFAFKEFANYFRTIQNSKLVWITDSTCVVQFLKKGSKIPLVQKHLLDIKKLEFEWDIHILPCWSPREDLNLAAADRGSKLMSSTEEYGLVHNQLIDIQDKFKVKIQLDAFASNISKRCVHYFAAFPLVKCRRC